VDRLGLGLVLRLACWEYISDTYIWQMALVCSHTEDSVAVRQMSVCHTEDNTHRSEG